MKALSEKNDCIIWQGTISDGYGTIRFKGKTWRIHRLVMMLYKPDEFTEDCFVCHHCDNPACYNIKHLYIGDAQSNINDMIERGRQGRLSPAMGRSNPKGMLNLVGVKRRMLRKIYPYARDPLHPEKGDIKVINDQEFKKLKREREKQVRQNYKEFYEKIRERRRKRRENEKALKEQRKYEHDNNSNNSENNPYTTTSS
jgi:hypothetical protein